MPYLISQSGVQNLTAAGSWGLVDQTSLLDSEVGSSSVSTTNLDSSPFTPGAITVDGVAVKVAARAASPSGTFTVGLINSTSSAVIDSVSINVSDIPAAGAAIGSGQGWTFMQFTAARTLIAGIAYRVRAVCSSVNQVALYRDATANNHSRMLRTTTTQAPVAGDNMFVLGGKTSAGGAISTSTIVMNQTVATDYGTASATLPALAIGDGGTLLFGTSESTNYVLRLSGQLDVYAGGKLQMGRSISLSSPCPRSSTYTLEFDCAVDGQFGLRVFNLGQVELQGQSRTSGKNVVRALLTANVATAATTLPLDTDTGWLSGDTICIASTTRTASQSERRILSGNANAANCVITAGLANAHDGVSPVQAEVGLLTRNVVVKSVSNTAMSYMSAASSSIVDIDWTQFSFLGTNTTGKRGIEINTTSAGGFSMAYSSMHDGDAQALMLPSVANDNINIQSCVLFNFAVATASLNLSGISAATSGTNIIFNDILFIQINTCTTVFLLSDVGITATNITIVGGGAGYGIQVQETGAVATGTFSNWIVHSCIAAGVGISPTLLTHNLNISNIKSYRNSSSGVVIGLINNSTLSTFEVFGNTTQNVSISNYCANSTLANFTVNGETSYTTANGLIVAAGLIISDLILDSCNFGAASGTKTTHSTADITLSATTITVICKNCRFNSTTEISAISSCRQPSYLSSQKHDQTVATHRTLFPHGTIQLDPVVFKTAAPSEQASPTSASVKLCSGSKKAAVPSGSSVTISVWVRKNSSYNGNAPRLILKKNTPAGIASDTVIATFSAAADTWQMLSGTTSSVTDDAILEFYVDCDGTAGLIYIDDWSVN